MISFNSYAFTETGSAQFARSSKFDPEPRVGRALRELVTWKIKEQFLEPSFADNQARYAELRSALAVGEGLLVITDESDRVLFSETVRVIGNDLPEQWGQYMAEVGIEFASLPKPVAQVGVDATFTPSGSTTPVVLPAVGSWRESVRTERYNAQVAANRRVTMVGISGSGRFTADPTQNETQRRAAVLAVKNALETCNNTPDGTLVYAGTSNVVWVEQMDCDIGDGTSYCDWSMAAEFRRFPDGDYAEVEFEVGTKDNIEQAQRITNVTGKIRANTEDAALARANALRDTFANSARIQTVNETRAQQVSGADGDAFIVMSFTFEWRDMLTPVAWTLTVATKADAKSDAKILTRSGTCRSGSSSAALSKAQELGVVTGAGVLMGSSLEYHSVGLASAAQDNEVTFSYEYLSRAGRVYAEVQNDGTDESFGDCGQTISGFVVADSQAAALALARSFKLSGGLLRSARENSSTFNAGTGTGDSAGFDAGGASQQFLKVDFNYSYYAGHTAGSVKYSVTDSRDMKSRVLTLTYAGTAWATDATAANALVDSLESMISGVAQTKRERRTDSEKRDSVSGFLAVNFTDAFEGPFAAAPGEGVLEAEYSVEAVLSVNSAVVTEIPYGSPVVQTGVGYNKGGLTVSGFATGVSESSCKAWGQARRTIAQGGGRYERPPREKTGYAFHFEAPSTVRVYRFDFTYSCDTGAMTSF